MSDITVWCGFLGAWLLVAGPVYQALLELREEQVETDRMRGLMSTVPAPAPASPWWWLVPPVKLALDRRRRERHQQAMVERLSDEDYAALTSFVNKAYGWLLVGGGGFLLAVKETDELVEQQDWRGFVFWLLVVLMTGLALGNTVGRAVHDQRIARSRGG